jgi:N-acyl-D-aspartate/D-glutamate deacylase
MQRDQAPDQWKRILARASAARTPIRVQVAARAIGVMLGLEATFHPFMGFPTYKAMASKPLAERVALLRDPSVRARLLAEKSDRVAGDGSAIPPLADVLLAQIERVSARLFRLGERPDYEQPVERSIAAEARARGIPPLAAVLDALLGAEGQELLYFPLYNYAGFNLDDLHTMLTHPLALAGLGDGGAHVGTVCDASFPTFMLAHWARGRERGRLSVERVVQMLAADTARHMGLADRGTVEIGKRADLNVIDLAGLALDRPRLVRDLPAGGKRLLQGARGYRATIVAGCAIAEDGRLTGERPGRVARPVVPRHQSDMAHRRPGVPRPHIGS